MHVHSPDPEASLPRFSVLPALLLASAVASSVLPGQSYGSAGSPLEGYRMLDLPRRNVPVGAIWQQGFGPNGRGAPAEALRVDSSASVLASDPAFRAKVEGGVLRLLGVTGARTGTTSLDLRDVQIVTVANISALQASPGNQVVYEAVKVGSLTVRSDRQTQADVQARFRRLGASVVVLDTGTVTAEGADLFVGYRVITLARLWPFEAGELMT